MQRKEHLKMSPRLLRFYFPLCLCLPLCLCFASESLAPSVFVVPHYSVTDLGILPAGKYVYVTGINNLGQVVGWVKFGQIKVFCSRAHGFLWNGKMQDLGVQAGLPSCKAFAVNDRAEIAGQDQADIHQLEAYAYIAKQRSFVWKNGSRTILPDVNSDRYNLNGADIGAVAINNHGQILGYAGLWQNSEITRIDLYPSGINDAGQVIGTKLAPYPEGNPEAAEGSSSSHPFLWQDGTETDLGLLPGAEVGEASGINAHGDVAGWMTSPLSSSGFSREYSFLWDGNRLIRLEELRGYSSSRAYGVNAGGQVVGKCVRHQGYAHAYCWQNGVMLDLNNSIPKRTGWVLEAAYGINNRGQIIGIGTHGHTHFRAFLLTPKK